MLKIELPWPHKDLSPNARVHWATKAKATRKARSDARFACMAAYTNMTRLRSLECMNKINVSFVFHPRDKRRRDIDNLIASTKAHRDGIADALFIDDSKFRLTAEMGEPCKSPCVVVTISL